MQATAKLFKSGNSQAVRLPKAFRMPGDVVWVSRNEVTGEITLTPKDDDRRKRNIALLFKMIRDDPFPEDFSFRDDSAPVEYQRDPFEDGANEEVAGPAK